MALTRHKCAGDAELHDRPPKWRGQYYHRRVPEEAASRPLAACDPGPWSLTFRLTCGGYMVYTCEWLSEQAGL